jgi:epoxyqueuosine reductase
VSVELKEKIRQKAHELGIDVCGFASPDADIRKAYFESWLEAEKAGTMDWMYRNNDKRTDPAALFEDTKTVIICGLNYYQKQPESRGQVATYALGRDYHKVFKNKIKKLGEFIEDELGGRTRPFVDTGPVMEKPLAASTGIGWQGKSTLLIHKKFGTWLFLGELFTNLDLPHDEDLSEGRGHCGKCSRCMDACPTNAIIAPYQLDARKCIAYLTIEHKGGIPVEYRRAIGNRIYGCDECLVVCPWNRWAVVSNEADFKSRNLPDIRVMLSWTEQDFFDSFAGSPIYRLKLERWKRNVCIVVGNIGSLEDITALELLFNESEMLREHAQWAINEIMSRNQIQSYLT